MTAGCSLDGARLLRRLDQLAAIGATAAGGVTRLAYSKQDLAGRDLVARWMREAGLAVDVDAAGNLLGRLPGTAGRGESLGTGSHLDSVVEAGPLDGAYGVVAAVEVADAIARSGGLAHDLLVVGFSNEEGARGTPGMIGSLAAAGALTAEHLAAPDDEGVSLAQRLLEAGGDPDRIAAAAWVPGDLAGWFELHIEQGPVLEAAGVRLGVVTAITGRITLDVVITGAANHAGTTPMALRRDAAVAAAHVVLAVHELAGTGAVRVATTGVLRTEPGVRNVVAGRALVGVDLRDEDDARVVEATATLRDRAAEIGARTGTAVEVVFGSQIGAVGMDPWLAGCVAAAADELGLPRMDLPSGAGHDTQVIAPIVPVGMLFVPSAGGVSHAPQERSAPDDLVDGARALLAALRRADQGRVDAGRLVQRQGAR
ncbi:MAG TPA: Zn-dependent hydrolase [Kineosporiaceae bacterium]|nr:Zn-dependent hydrolase [Kineosporiaceae bacterium]